MILESMICFIVLLIGLYGLIFSDNIIKSIISLSLVETAVILIFIFLTRPVGNGLAIIGMDTLTPVDPLPQALMITAIVIGASTTSLALMFSVKLFHYYGSLSWNEIFERMK